MKIYEIFELNNLLKGYDCNKEIWKILNLSKTQIFSMISALFFLWDLFFGIFRFLFRIRFYEFHLFVATSAAEGLMLGDVNKIDLWIFVFTATGHAQNILMFGMNFNEYFVMGVEVLWIVVMWILCNDTEPVFELNLKYIS